MWSRARARLAHWRERFGPRTADALVLLVALAIGVGQLFGDSADSFPLGRAIAWPVLFLSAGALWWRRRWPTAITLAGCVAFALSSLGVPALFGLVTLAIRRRDRRLAAVTATVYVLMTVEPAITEDKNIFGQGLATFFIVGLCLAFGSYVGARRDLVSSLRERADRAEAERELRAEQARLGERARIAQEMHDVLAHKVSLIALHAGALELNPDSGGAQVERSAVLIRSTARQALEDLRGVLGVLRSDDSTDGAQLTPQPKLADVRRLVEASRAAGVTVRLLGEGDAGAFCDDDAGAASDAGSHSVAEVSDVLGRTAYRVVQEGLTNVHKHARGASATVRLGGSVGGRLTISVANPRPVASGSLLPGAGAGLVGLRERVELAGGELRSGRDANGGWLLEAWLPWVAPSRAEVGA